MITEKGKSILGKYLASQNDSTFSYIALGVGAVPAYDPVAGPSIGGWEDESGLWNYTYFNGNDSNGNQKNVSQGFVPEYNKLDVRSTEGSVKYSDMKELDFEVLRVPITESGVEYVKSEGKDKYFTDIVLTATVPSFDRYDFTEVGVYSAQSNAIATTKSSQLLFKFSPEENWNNVNQTAVVSSNIDNESRYYPYNNKNFTNFFENSSQLYKAPRVGSWCVSLGGEISNNVAAFGFNSVRPDDEFRLAYFFTGTENVQSFQSSATITFTDALNRTAKGDFKTNTNTFGGNSDLIPTHADFGQTYGVGVVAVKDLILDTGFSWGSVKTVTIDAKDGAPSIMLDALRFVSTNYNNPNYGLIAYSVVQNRNGSTPEDFFVDESGVDESGVDESGVDESGVTIDFSQFVIPEPIVKRKGLETLIQYRIRVSESLNGEDYVAF